MYNSGDKLLRIYNKLDGTIKLVTGLFQRDLNSHDKTMLLQKGCIRAVRTTLQSDKSDKLVYLQVVNKLLRTCDKHSEHNLLTACLQTCYKLCDFMRAGGQCGIVGALNDRTNCIFI